MKPKTRCYALLLCVSIGMSSAWAHEARRPAASTEKLGTVHFPVSCTADAQQQFDRAMALYHSFY